GAQKIEDKKGPALPILFSPLKVLHALRCNAQPLNLALCSSFATTDMRLIFTVGRETSYLKRAAWMFYAERNRPVGAIHANELGVGGRSSNSWRIQRYKK